MISLVVTACLWAHPMKCEEIRLPTIFRSVDQCASGVGQQALAQIMKDHPGRFVARYVCEEMKKGREA